jgi:hypothetical protein
MVDFTCEPRELTAMLVPIATPAAIRPYSMEVFPKSLLANPWKTRTGSSAVRLKARQLPSSNRTRLLGTGVPPSDNFATLWQVPF